MPEKESTNGNAPQASNAASNQTTGAAQPQPPSPPAAQPLNNTRKRTPDEYTKNFDLNEISPLHTSSGSSNGSGGAVASKGSNASDKSDLNARNGALLPPVVLQMRAADAGVDAAGPTATVDATFLPGSKRNKFRGRYDELMGRLDLSERSRVPFAVLVALCAVLLIVVIVLVALWPRLPAYLRTPVCVERECLEASAQILLWANVTTESVCQQPYEWACGRFDEDYADNPLNGIYGGEWTAASSAEYEELLQIHTFVAQLPTPALSSAQLTLKRLHADCMKSDMVDKKTADFALSQAIRSLSSAEWVYSRDWVPNAWDMQSAVSIAHAKFGLSPFFSVSVQNRNSAPFGNIIALSEGSLGLPHQMFYNLRHDHRIIEAYKMLLRDFAINFGTVAEVAKKFADEMFYFEKRITNTLPRERTPAILTLGEVQRLAPMLPIAVTIARIFSNTNVDESTPIWVEDADMLREMSIIVSTSDVNPLNSFLVWSLARHYMPFMSAEYRDALRNFNGVLYGHKSQPPAWLQCAKLLHDWVPLAVDALRFNPELVVTPQTSARLFDRSAAGDADDQHQYSEPLVRDRIDYDRELVRLMFAHLRHQMQRAVDDNVAIQTDVTAYINDQLNKVQLHIGLPEDAVASTAYVNAFFAQFMFHKLNFIEKLESRWSFAMRTRELQMVAKNATDKIVSALYPSTGAERSRTLVQYSIDLHAIVVSEQAVHKPYFHHKYPLAINFARLGAQISSSLLAAVNALGTEFEQRRHRNATLPPFTLGDYACLTAQLHPDPQQQPAPDAARQHYLNDLTAATFTAKAFAEFQRMLAANRPVPDAGLSDLLTYDRMGLRAGRRQAGLQRLDAGQLFAVATLQTHCGRGVSDAYRRYKPFVEGRVAQRDLFDSTWSQVPLLSRFLQCPASPTKCESVL